jgi:Flp pilus assembly pilin Flp
MASARHERGPAGPFGETGATSVEYAVMLVGIAALVVGIVFVLGLQTDGLFDLVVTRWQTRSP